MSNVTLKIGGREYTVACAAGEENHVRMLGEKIEGKIVAMGGGGKNETQRLLFAALLLADEAHEAGKAAAPAAPPPVADQHADALEAIAMRLENLATRLEG